MSLFRMVLVLLLIQAPALAERATALVVRRDSGAEDCPTTEQLAHQVNGIVGRDVIGAGPGDDAAWIEVNITRGAAGYHASLRTFGRTVGKREFDDSGEDCTGLAEALAVSLALMWTSQAGSSPGLVQEEASQQQEVDVEVDPPGHSQPAEEEPRPSKSPRQRRLQPDAPPRRERRDSAEPLHAGVGMLAGGAVAVLEHAVPSVELEGWLGLGTNIAVGVAAGGAGPDRIEHAQGGVDVGLLYGTAVACLIIPEFRRRARLCARPMFGVLSGRGRGFDLTSRETLPYWALALGLDVRGMVTENWRWIMRVVALTPLVRQEFTVVVESGSESVFVTPGLGLLASAGVGWELGP